jgi:hypothetical protein
MESLAEILAAVSQMREMVALKIGVDWCFYPTNGSHRFLEAAVKILCMAHHFTPLFVFTALTASELTNSLQFHFTSSLLQCNGKLPPEN